MPDGGLERPLARIGTGVKMGKILTTPRKGIHFLRVGTWEFGIGIQLK